MKSERCVAHLLCGQEKGGIATVLFSIISENRQANDLLFIALKKTDLTEDIGRAAGRTEIVPAGYVINPFSLLYILFLIRKKQIKIIHTHSIVPHIYGLLLKICQPKTLFVAHVHADIYRELLSNISSSFKRKIYYAGSLMALKRSSVIVANSEAVRGNLIEKGIPSAKIKVVHNGINIGNIERKACENHRTAYLFKRIGNKKVIGTIGRMTPIKNHRLLITAAREVIAQYRDVFFIMIGDGKEKGNLERMVSDLGLTDHFFFTGWLDSPYSVLSIMDIFVLTSTWEGLGLVVLEAMALKKPVIATNVGGVPEIIGDGETGILIPSGDSNALARALIKLLNDSALRQRMGEAGRTVAARDFSTTSMMNGIEQAYSMLSGVS